MAIITSKLQSDRYEKCYFHEIWMEIAWAKIMHLGH